jgi:TM2 domain-containing membrane protein YozV
MNAYWMPGSPEYAALSGLDEARRMYFLTQLNAMRKDAGIGILLAFFLGSFGAHWFYLGRNGLGLLYLCFFWTGIPALVALVECFLMPERVRRYNAASAAAVLAQMGVRLPVPSFAGLVPVAPGIVRL